MLRFFILFLLIIFPWFCKAECPLTLSLDEAIYLAVRENPNVQQAQLNLVLQKFSLYVQQWQFQPHFSFQATATTGETIVNDIYRISKGINIQPAASWLSPFGTETTVTSVNNVTGHYHPAVSVQVMQPLMRGFGRPVVEAALYNAYDSTRISCLNVEGTLRATVTNVIVAYLNVIAAQSVINVDLESIKRAQISVQQTKLFIKAGRKAGVELVTVNADVATAQTRLENDKNTLQQARYALLAAIGIDPNTPVRFTSINIPELIKKFHIPDLTCAKELMLENDIQFQIDQITLYGPTKRNLLVAEDNTRWQLNFTGNAVVGGGSGNGENAGINSIFNGKNLVRNATLSLTIPIDDRNAKLAVASARTALREAEIALRQEKWNKETSAINAWNSIYSAERALHFAEESERLEQKTYDISFKKYSYGLIDSIALQSVQQQLVAREQGLVSSRINYLLALVNLDQLMGKTLKTWHVQVRYD